MSRQIAIRLPEDLVVYIDEQADRAHGSRASVVSGALEEQRRRRRALLDAEILMRTGDYPDFEKLVSAPDLSDLD